MDADRHDAGLEQPAPPPPAPPGHRIDPAAGLARSPLAAPLVGATDQPTMQVRQVPTAPPSEGESLAALAPLLAPAVPAMEHEDAPPGAVDAITEPTVETVPVAVEPVTAIPALSEPTAEVPFEPTPRPSPPPIRSSFFGDADPGERVNLGGHDDDDAIEPDETIDPDDELPEDLRIGRWVPDVAAAPTPVPLSDAITQLLPLVPRQNAGPDLESVAPPTPTPVLNLPVKRPKAWLLPGGRSQAGNSEDWEAKHKHPRTVRLRYAAGILALGGVTTAVLYGTMGSGRSTDGAPATTPGPITTAASPSDQAGGVIASAAASPSAAPTTAKTSPSATTSKSSTPSTAPSTLGIGGDGKPGPTEMQPWFVEAESGNNAMAGRARIINSPKASGGLEVFGVGGSGDTLEVRSVPVPATGRYTLSIWYSSSFDRTAYVSINGGEPIRVDFPDAGASEDIGLVTVVVALNAGENTLLWTADQSAPAFDRFSVDN